MKKLTANAQELASANVIQNVLVEIATQENVLVIQIVDALATNKKSSEFSEFFYYVLRSNKKVFFLNY
ncbi:MAG: hypothetical protein Q3988_03715 [Gemella sp.]|nr:hypothetical protein [Gemella sp.]